jgi:DNA-binding LytR/AlgR family response regulator
MEKSISFFIVDDEPRTHETLSKSLAFFLPMLKSLERQSISICIQFHQSKKTTTGFLDIEMSRENGT